MFMVGLGVGERTTAGLSCCRSVFLLMLLGLWGIALRTLPHTVKGRAKGCSWKGKGKRFLVS